MNRLALSSLVLAVAALACTGDDAAGDEGEALPACVEVDYEGCAELYPPTWDQVWAQTLANSCDGGGGACHASDDIVASESGLALVDPADAHARLTEGPSPHVVAGDPQCSPLMVRLEIDDPSLRMPPGETPIPAGARCSIAHWIRAGASVN